MGTLEGGCVNVTGLPGKGAVWMTLAGPTLKMPNPRGGFFSFEIHPYCGPSFVSPRSGNVRMIGPRSRFWRQWERWILNAQTVDGDVCVLAPERAFQCPVPQCPTVIRALTDVEEIERLALHYHRAHLIPLVNIGVARRIRDAAVAARSVLAVLPHGQEQPQQ